MRILSAFFAVLFTFINPCMLYKVVSELESSFSHHMSEKVRIRLLESICAYFINNNLTSRLRLAVYVSVLLFSILHIIMTGLALYGHYNCRPSYIRPFIVDGFISFFILLFYMGFSMMMYIHLNSNGSAEEKELMRTQLRNVYVAAAFLLAYMAWLVVSIAAYIDTKKLRAEFMYWIVEEKISMRSKANASSERSDRSSKGSKISYRSRASNRSNLSSRSLKSDVYFSETVQSRTSPVDARSSVPL